MILREKESRVFVFSNSWAGSGKEWMKRTNGVYLEGLLQSGTCFSDVLVLIFYKRYGILEEKALSQRPGLSRVWPGKQSDEKNNVWWKSLAWFGSDWHSAFAHHWWSVSDYLALIFNLKFAGVGSSVVQYDTTSTLFWSLFVWDIYKIILKTDGSIVNTSLPCKLICKPFI